MFNNLDYLVRITTSVGGADSMKMISLGDIKSKIQKYIRVLKITKKPSKEEFLAALKITGIGVLLIGLIGFIIYLIMKYSGIFV